MKERCIALVCIRINWLSISSKFFFSAQNVFSLQHIILPLWPSSNKVMNVSTCSSGGIWSQLSSALNPRILFYNLTALSQGGTDDFPIPVVTTDMLKPPIVCTIRNDTCGFVQHSFLVCELLPLPILPRCMTHSSKGQRPRYQQLPVSAFLQHWRNRTHKEDIRILQIRESISHVVYTD